MLESLTGSADRVAWAVLIALAGLVFSRLMRSLARRWTSAEPASTGDLTRLRRRETAAILASTAVRYLLLVVAAATVVSIFVEDRLTAAASATLVVLVLAFSAQRLLQDFLAGLFILLENQYGVGDFIEIEPSKYAGVVEEVGFRTTVMRDLNGDVYFIPNGQIMAVKRSRRRYRTFTVELLTREPERAREAVRAVAGLAPVGGARFLRPPRIADEHELDEGLWRLLVQADVPPRMEWLAEEYLVSQLKRRLGDDLLADPIAMALDEAAVSRYRRTVVVR
ncbi:MAG: mechanosensitive ion channel family protein [Thermoleophilia bacterium]|nr:mechanosensitive ion channel family protein [Thermoleophilia bacterium]